MNVQPKVVTQPQGAATQPKTNNWQTDLCDCFSDCGVYLGCFFCTCFLTQVGSIISANRTASMLALKTLLTWVKNHLQQNNQVQRTSRTQQLKCLCGCFCFPCLSCQVATAMNECCCCGATVTMRSVYRTKYNLPGSICGDALVVGCFPTCSLCQVQRDIKKRKEMGIF